MKRLRWIPLLLVLAFTSSGCGGAEAAIALYRYYVIYQGFQSQEKDRTLVESICSEYGLEYQNLDPVADQFTTEITEVKAKQLRADSRIVSVTKQP